MSAPRMIAELVVTGIRVLGKATAAAGQQAVRNFKHKPEGAAASGPVGTGSSKSQITNQMQMSLDEAHLILNVKKEDPLDVIEKNFERIFKSNSPAPEPAAPTAPAAGTRPQPAATRKSKLPTHSHYLQSKVYRALERIKAERDADVPPPPEGGVGAGTTGEAAATAAAAPGAGATAAGQGGSTAAGSGSA